MPETYSESYLWFFTDILNYKFTMTRHRNMLRVSGNEKKNNITKYSLKKEYIYIYILVEYFVFNIYTK